MINPPDADRTPSTVAIVLRVVAAFLLVMFAIGVGAGWAASTIRHDTLDGKDAIGLAAVALIVGLIAALAWRVVRPALPTLTLPSSPRMRKSRIALYAAFGVAIPAGLLLSIGGTTPAARTAPLFTDAPLPAWIATATIVGYIVSMAFSLRWHATVDEHERTAYEFGGVVASYSYVTLAPVWWLAARGGLAPPVDGMAIFWLTLVAWIVGWFWRRQR